MPGEYDRENRASRTRYVQLTLLVWVAMMGVDFFLHGGIFAALYVQDSAFLLPAMDAFLRIPFGYLAILATAGLLVWIVGQTSARGWRKGLPTGLALGAVMGASSSLGLYSISTASPQLLAAWFAAQVLEMGTAGVVIGQGLAMDKLRSLTLAVIFGLVFLVLVTIVLQNVGLSPSVVIR